MKVSCLIITCNATLDVGGEAIFAKELATELRMRKDISPTFIIRNELKGAEIIRDLKNYQRRLPRIRNPILLVANLLLYTMCALPTALKFIKESRQRKQITIIHAHDGAFSGVVGTIAGKLSGTPTIVTFHGTHILSAYHIFGRLSRVGSIVATFLCNFCIKNADQLVAVDPKTQQYLRSEVSRREGRNILIVPTFGRELNAQKQIVGEQSVCDSPLNSKLIGYVGRLSPEKNVLSIVEAFNEVSKIRSDVCLIIIGDGNLRRNIVQYAKDMGIQNRVFLLGYLLDVGAVLRKLACLVLASKSEGFPQVILEAWSCGIPVVASDRIPFLRNRKNALTFPPDDIEKQKETIMQVLSNPELVEEIIGNAKRSLHSFSREWVTAKYYSLFMHTLKNFAQAHTCTDEDSIFLNAVRPASALACPENG